MRRAELEHFHRSVLEECWRYDGQSLLEPHSWLTPRRRLAEIMALVGNANLALLLSAVIAIVTLMRQRHLTLGALGHSLESSLMSAGIIILITASGGAFGQMLKEARVGQAIETVFGGLLAGSANGLVYLTTGFLLAAALKIAQGSSTVAMIVGSSMMSAMVVPSSLPFHPVYLATAIGAGSLVGSWMNDSGFWVYAKMGGLTETESLKSWTTLLIVLAVVSWVTTMVLSSVLPLK
jgi:H+/gluconate symporter-like permease